MNRQYSLASSWLFFVACLPLLFPATSRATHSFTNFPAPVGFIESSRLSPRLKAIHTVGQVPPTELIGVYYATNVLAEILNNGRTFGPELVWKANFKGSAPSIPAAKESFATLCKNAKQDGLREFDLNDPKTKTLLEHHENAIAKQYTNSIVNVQGLVSLGVIAERKNILAISGLITIRNGSREEGWVVDMPFVMEVGYLRIGLSQVDVVLLYPFKGAESIETANAKFLEWIRMIEDRYNLKND